MSSRNRQLRFLSLAFAVVLLSSLALAGGDRDDNHEYQGEEGQRGQQRVKVPEPSILMLTGTALAGLGGAIRLRKRS